MKLPAHKTCPKCKHRSLMWDFGWEIKEQVIENGIKEYDVKTWDGICSNCNYFERYYIKD